MLGLTPLMGVAAWVLSVGMVAACPQGYESHAALVQSARLILGVKVTSVADVREPDDKEAKSPDERAGRHAQARVKVTEVVRGSCKVTEFKLTGGPYDTCAPGPNYVLFEMGETFYLLLDRPLPEDTRNVVVTWRGRVFGGTKAELDALLKRTEEQRVRMVELHRELFPEAMCLLLAMPDARLAPTVKKLLQESNSSSRLTDFFEYFAKLGEASVCLETLDRFERLVDGEMKEEIGPADRKRAGEFVGYQVGMLAAAARKHQLKSDELEARLKHLAEIYPPKPPE